MRRMALFVVASCIAAWRPGPRGGAVGVGAGVAVGMERWRSCYWAEIMENLPEGTHMTNDE